MVTESTVVYKLSDLLLHIQKLHQIDNFIAQILMWMANVFHIFWSLQIPYCKQHIRLRPHAGNNYNYFAIISPAR